MRATRIDDSGRKLIGILMVLGFVAVLLTSLVVSQGSAGAAPGAQATPAPGTPVPAPGGSPTPLPTIGVTPTPAVPIPTPDVAPTPVPGADSTETAGAAILASLSVLLQEHVYGVTAATAASISNRNQEAEAAQSALDRNNADLSRLLRSFYGASAADQFADLWEENVEHLLAYGDAVRDEDEDAREEIAGQLADSATQAEEFLTGANEFLQPGTIEMLLMEHAELMMAAIDSQPGAGASERPYMAARQAAHQTRVIADVLASALVRQFSEEVQILDTVYAVVGAWNRRDVEAFLELWTDDGLQASFEVSREEAEEGLSQFIGTQAIQIRNFENVEIDNDQASAEIELQFGAGYELLRQQFVRENGIWRMDIDEMLEPELPEGVALVDVEMDEFAFIYDEQDLADGNVSFRAINVGEQPHELALVRIAEGQPSIEELLERIDPESQDKPEGIRFVAGTFVEPGEVAILALAYPLAPGRYAMVCFIPDQDDPEGTPHALLGMVSEFEVE